MRTITPAEDAVLTSQNRSVAVRVFVDDGSGDFVDLSTLADTDWVKAVTVDEDNSRPIASATVTIVREAYEYSLATFVSGSPFNQGTPLIRIGRDIKIETATIGQDTEPAESDYELLFEGEIFETEMGGTAPTMQLKCRDNGGKLQQDWIKTQTTHGGGSNIATVIQAILNTHASAPVPTLFTPVARTLTIPDYIQNAEPVMDAIQKLAQQDAGADVRYLWDNGTGAFRLTLFEPDRTKTVPDRTFTADEYFEVTRLGESKTDIRNDIDVVFSNSATGERDTKNVTDAASITKYRTSYMQIAEASNSSIDTTTEATALANAALDDLSEPDADFAVVLDYFSKIQLGDLYEFPSNDLLFDSTQTFAVVSFRHELVGSDDGKFKATTTALTRGKPSLGSARWLVRDARGGNAPPADLEPPALPTGITLFPGVASMRLLYDPTPEEDWYSTEVWMHTASMTSTTFPNRPATGSLVAEGKQNEFQLDGLVPNTTYFFRLIVKDIKGNFVGTSSQVSETTQRVGPYHENDDGQFDQLCRNSDFGIATLDIASFPPDFWTVPTGVWGTDVDEVTTVAGTLSGGRALEMFVTSSVNPEIESDFIPFEGGDLVVAGFVGKGNITPASTSIKIFVRFFNSSKSFISSQSTSVTVENGTFERRESAVFAAPSTTRFIRLLLQADRIGTDYTLTVDQFGCSREFATASRDAQFQSFAGIGTINPVVMSGTANAEEIGISFASNIYTIDFPGIYQFVGYVAFEDPGAGGQFECAAGIQLNGAGSVTGMTQNSVATGIVDEAGIPMATPWLDLVVGDTIQMFATLYSAPTPTDIDIKTSSFLTGRCLLRSIR